MIHFSGKPETLQKSPGKFRGIAWKDKDVEDLIELMKEETIMFSLENTKTPKEKRAVYKSVQVQLQKQGLIKQLTTCTSAFVYSSVKQSRERSISVFFAGTHAVFLWDSKTFSSAMLR